MWTGEVLKRQRLLADINDQAMADALGISIRGLHGLEGRRHLTVAIARHSVGSVGSMVRMPSLLPVRAPYRRACRGRRSRASTCQLKMGIRHE
jgi:hypothetical protein